MAKDRVYSWRVDGEKLTSLEIEARREGTSVAELLDRVTGEWLTARRGANDVEGSEEARARSAARRVIGSLSGGDPTRSTRVRELARSRLKAKRDR